MVRTRIPIQRQSQTTEFIPEVIAAFTRLRQIHERGCSCPDIDNETILQEGYPADFPFCASCKAYDKAEAKVVRLLKLKPWQVLENPYLESVYPPGSHAEKSERNDRGGRAGRELWRRLERAADLPPLEEATC
jgi:hypothetical protein